MEREKIINRINVELEELKVKLGDDSYNRFINNHSKVKKYIKRRNNKLLLFLLSDLYLKQVYALVHERNYY